MEFAEEMNSEWLVRNKSIQSMPSRVATELGLSHRYCDPTAFERVRAGINGRGEILLNAELNGFSEDERVNRLAAEEIKREQYWLREQQNQGI